MGQCDEGSTKAWPVRYGAGGRKTLHPKGELRSPNGRVFYEMPSPAIEERFGGTTVVVHRADLQKTLCAVLGKEAIRPGAEWPGVG